MIEIKCNKTEKSKIIDALCRMEIPCLFPRKATFCPFNKEATCKECLETGIHWIPSREAPNGKPEH